jgi:hypothetical protein
VGFLTVCHPTRRTASSHVVQSDDLGDTPEITRSFFQMTPPVVPIHEPQTARPPEGHRGQRPR